MTQYSASSSSSGVTVLPPSNLRFLASRMRLFLKPRFNWKRPAPSDSGSEKPGCGTDVAAVGGDYSYDESVTLRRAVKQLHFGSEEEKVAAAVEVERLARDDPKAKKLMADLGVILVLVSMAVSEVHPQRIVAVKALIQLAHGSYTNKARMVEAGIWQKLPMDVESFDESTGHAFAKLLLSLSSLANRQFPVGCKSLRFLIKVLDSNSNTETKDTILAALYNLSVLLENAGSLVSNGAVQILLKLVTEKDLSEKALAVLGLIVVTLMGKKAMEDDPSVPDCLMEILTWEDKPKCQELSVYILMILAHQSSKQREKMAKSGIVTLLLELALLGTPLAQKRAMKLLQWFKDERQLKLASHSGPQVATLSTLGSPISPRTSEEGRKMMKSLVKQSLHRNMENIIQRASSGVGESSNLRSLVISTSSKSLPY